MKLLPRLASLSVDAALQQYVEIAGGGGLNNLQEGSISMFVRWAGPQDGTGFGTYGHVLARQKNGDFSNHSIALSGSNPASARLTWQPYQPTSGTITGSTPVGDGEWRHVAITFSSGAHALYIDGELETSSATVGSSSRSTRRVNKNNRIDCPNDDEEI